MSPNGPKRDSTRPTSPRSSIGCVQNDFQVCGTFGANRAPRQDYHYLQIYQNELPPEPCHLVVPTDASNTISKPMVRWVRSMHQYCIDTNIVSKRTKTRLHMTHSPRSSIECVQHDFQAYGTFGTYRAPILRQDYYCLQTDSNKLPLEPRHLGVSFGVSKMISEHMVRLVQTKHPSCTYIAPAVTVSPNVPKQDSTRPTSPRTSILCVQNIFSVYGWFGTNSTPILRQDQHYLQMR
jgi:hypothetical protein